MLSNFLFQFTMNSTVRDISSPEPEVDETMSGETSTSSQPDTAGQTVDTAGQTIATAGQTVDTPQPEVSEPKVSTEINYEIPFMLRFDAKKVGKPTVFLDMDNPCEVFVLQNRGPKDPKWSSFASTHQFVDPG